MSLAFLDSNVLVYCFTDGDPRQERALELLARDAVISVQCLNEFAAVGTRKLRMEWPRAEEALEQIQILCVRVLPVDLNVHRSGIILAKRHQLSVYDGMIVAAALAAGCGTLYSEDMHDGLVVGGRLTIANPFAA